MVTVCADYAAVVVEEQPLIGDYEGLLRLGRREKPLQDQPSVNGHLLDELSGHHLGIKVHIWEGRWYCVEIKMETTTVTLIMRTVNESLTLETMSNQEENGTSPEETTTLGNTFPTSTEQNPGKFHCFIVSWKFYQTHLNQKSNIKYVQICLCLSNMRIHSCMHSCLVCLSDIFVTLPTSSVSKCFHLKVSLSIIDNINKTWKVSLSISNKITKPSNIIPSERLF